MRVDLTQREMPLMKDVRAVLRQLSHVRGDLACPFQENKTLAVRSCAEIVHARPGPISQSLRTFTGFTCEKVEMHCPQVASIARLC